MSLVSQLQALRDLAPPLPTPPAPVLTHSPSLCQSPQPSDLRPAGEHGSRADSGHLIWATLLCSYASFYAIVSPFAGKAYIQLASPVASVPSSVPGTQ